MAIVSPYNSFVEFGPVQTNCKGNTTRVALPVIDNLAIKFQFNTEELLPVDTVFKAAVCSSDCETIDNPDYNVIPLCTRFLFMVSGVPLSDGDFPILVGNYAPIPDQPQIPEGLYSREDLLAIISELYETSLPGIDFYDCCNTEYPEISGIVVFPNGIGSAKTLSLAQYFGTGYVNYPATVMEGIIEVNECFRYCILDDADEVLACSNLFYRETDECYTSVFTYYNEENAYGFKYPIYDDNGVSRIPENTIRLKVNFSRPQFPVSETLFRQPNGLQQRLSTIIQKEWLGRVAWMDDVQHEKLLIALKHDHLFVQNEEKGIDYRMTQIGEYEIGYPDIDTDKAPAEFRINDYSNNNVNNNCGFECGVEFSPDCDSEGGGSVIPCPERYSVEFIGSDGVMEPGNLVYQDDNLINKAAVEVYREGLFQYATGSNTAVYNPATGEVTFTPIVELNERIAIWEA